MDLIERQMAIDAMKKLYDVDLEAYGCEIPEMFDCDRAIEALKELPSAQPQQTCEYWDSESKFCALHRPSVQPDHPADISKKIVSCEDAVSRQRLLTDLKELIVAWKKYPVMAEQIKGVETAIGYVKTIPSVTPKRKTGKWIYPHETTRFVSICPECGAHGCGNFCSNCGADMRGETEPYNVNVEGK